MLIPKQNIKSICYIKDYKVSSASKEAKLFHCSFQMKFRHLTENNFFSPWEIYNLPLPGFSEVLFH